MSSDKILSGKKLWQPSI